MHSLLGKNECFLADVNIQFRKQLDGAVKKSERITIEHSLKKDDRILEIANFKYSKFSEDPELAKRWRKGLLPMGFKFF